jgi:type II secretory pathway component PulF
MTTYKFEAFTAQRKLVTGEVFAATEAGAEQAIRKLGHQRIISIKADKSIFQLGQMLESLTRPRIRERDIMDFSYELAQLLGSGITLMKALDYIGEATKNKSMKSLLEGVIQAIQNGNSFSQAISEYKSVFSESYIQVIRASEKSGNLEKGLTHLADNIGKGVEIRKSLKRVLTYPTIVLSLALCVCVFLVLYVIPAISGIFKSMNAEMPFMTRAMIGISSFISGHALTLFAVLLILVLSFWAFRRSEKGKRSIDRFLLRLPVVRGIILTSSTLSYSHMCAMLLKSGLQLPQAMHYSAQTVTNESLREILRDARTRLLQGQSLTMAIKGTNLFSRLAIEKLSIGERTGDIVSAFEFVATANEKALEEKRNAFVATIEPVITICIGCMVALIAISTILPMYSLAGQIK